MDKKSDSLHYALIAIIAFCVFANTFGHGFVYDDNRQILMNPLIQRSELYGKALTSDVWAFKGGGELAASNFFRPTFVGWMIVNWFVFGPSPSGWHFTNVLLHVGVCLLLFAFLRRLGGDRFGATVIALLFAVHPVHVENVAWLAGATDPLLALFLFASLIFAHIYVGEDRPQRRKLFLALSIVTYLLALGSKEVAMFCVPLYWLIFRRAAGEVSTFGRNAIYRTVPFAVAAIGFFIVRVWVLKSLFLPVEDPVPAGTALLTVPKLFTVYITQMFFPLWLGPALPVRPVDAVDLASVILPVAVSIAIIGAMVLLAKRSFIQMFGLALFALTLIPVLNPSTFSTEHIAHDRYLYLPVAGMLLVVIPALAAVMGVQEARNRKVLAGAFGVVALALATLTISYNAVWANGEKLWRHAVTIDPASAHAWSQLASVTMDPAESLRAYERSIGIRKTPTAVVGKARALIGLGNNDGAVIAAREVIAVDPHQIDAYTLFQAYEAETFALAALGRHSEAATSLTDARRRLPIYHAALTEKLSVVLYSANRKKEALDELEAAREIARREDLPQSKTVLLRLGMLHAELGNREAARKALREYLIVTEGLGGVPAADRQQAAALLGKL